MGVGAKKLKNTDVVQVMEMEKEWTDEEWVK